MRFVFQLSIFFLSCLLLGGFARGKNDSAWSEIREQFDQWEVLQFRYLGQAADGGSHGFGFITTEKESFTILVANSSYSTKDELENGFQLIFLVHKGNRYRIQHKSEIEAQLVAKLNTAIRSLEGESWANPKYIRCLVEIIESRASYQIAIPWELPIDWPYQWLQEWPYDKFDFEPEYGDWSKIQNRFSKWKILEFNEWAFVTAPEWYSKMFSFKTTEDMEFGVLAPVCHDPLMSIKKGIASQFGQAGPLVFPEADEFPQSFYLYFENQLFLIEQGSLIEKQLVAMLGDVSEKWRGNGASDPKYIKRLRDVIISREQPDFNYWPMTYEESSKQRESFFATFEKSQ